MLKFDIEDEGLDEKKIVKNIGKILWGKRVIVLYEEEMDMLNRVLMMLIDFR